MNDKKHKLEQLLRKYPNHLHDVIHLIEQNNYSWKKELQDCWVDISLGNSRHLEGVSHSHFIYMRDFLTYLIEEKLN